MIKEIKKKFTAILITLAMVFSLLPTTTLTALADSSDASLTSILEQAITAGGEAGTTAVPKTASISVANDVSTVAASDIVKHDAGASVTFYGKDSSFNTLEAGNVSLTAGSGTDVYIKVVAADNTTLFYKVTINRGASLTDMNITGVRFATFDITQNPMIATIDVEMADIGLNTGDFTITDTSNPGSTVTINNVTYSGGKYILAVSGMNLYDSYTLGITKTGYAAYSNDHFYGTLAAAGDLDLVNEPNIFPTYSRELVESGVTTIKNSTYASGAKLYSGAVYDAIDGNNNNPDNGTVTRLVGIFAKAPNGAKAVKTLRVNGQMLKVADDALIDGNPNYQETVQNGKDYYNSHKDDPGFVDNGYWKTLTFVPMYSQIATERQSDNSRVLVDPADRFRIIEWYDNEDCTGDPIKSIRLMVKVDYTGSITVEANTPPAPKATAGEEYIDVTDVTTGAALKLYTANDSNLVPATYKDLGGGTYRFENILPNSLWYYVIQSFGGKDSVNSQFVNPTFRTPVATGGQESVDVTNVSSKAAIHLHMVSGGGIVSTSPTALGNGTYRFENVTPDKEGFYVIQSANGIQSDNSPFVGVNLRTPSISGGTKQITVSNIFSGAQVILYDSDGNQIQVANNVTTATHQFTNLVPGSGYYVTQSINGVLSLPSGNATVYANGPKFVGGTENITVSQSLKATDLRDQLYVSDLDVGQTLTWTVISGPSHGTLTGFPVTAPTNGSGGIYGTAGSTDIRIPTPVAYVPDNGYIGSDSFTLQVSDGSDIDTRTLNVNVNSTSGSEVTANNSAELIAAINNPAVTTINLKNGITYQIGGTEINRPLTINGNGAVVEALHGVGQSFDNQTIYHLGMPDADGNRRYRGNIFWYVKDGGNLTLNDLTLRNGATSENAQGLKGIFAAILLNDASDLSISGVSLENFWFKNSKFTEQNNLHTAQGLYSTYSDLSFGVYADYNCSGTISISDSTFGSTNSFRDAVHIYNGNHVTVKDSTFIGTSFPERLRIADGYEYGIYLYGGNCTIINNHISGYDSKIIDGYSSAGVALIPFNDVDATIQNNSFQGNDLGIDLTGGWKSYKPGADVKINNIALNTEDNGFKIGEALKVSNPMNENKMTNIFLKLDQDDADDAFVYYNPFLLSISKNEAKPVLNFSNTSDAKKILESAITIEVEKSEDNGQSWSTASVEGVLNNHSTSAAVNLDLSKNYSLRVKMTHNNNQSPNTVITGYSNAVTFTASLSSDATLTSILGKSITAGSQTGTSEAPKLVSINVENAVSTIAGSDIVKHGSEATVTFYGTDSSFKTPAAGGVNLIAGSATDVYIKVMAADGTTLYYKVSINRAAASGGNSSSSGSSTSSTANSGISVFVNGKAETAGTSKSSTNEKGQTVTTVTVDTEKLEKILDTKGNNAIVTIPLTNNADIEAGVLTGQMVKNMEKKEAVLEVKTSTATYSLPASEINIDAVSKQLGQSITLSDIKVQIEIAKPATETVKVVENATAAKNLSIVVQAVDFSINCTYNGRTVEVSRFNSYIERTVAIPEGVDPNKITTGIIVGTDGTTRHVPTKIAIINGKYYAVINSLTNSTYAVVWNPIEFSDVSNHWAKDAINNMGSRMVIAGVGNNNFAPGRDITRAEFAAIIVRALGLAPESGKSSFSDVETSKWYCGYIETASKYGVIQGYNTTSFGPNDKITREQAMTMIARSMKITGLKAEISDSEISALLAIYSDRAVASEYAKTSIAECLKTGIITGRSSSTIVPKNYITRGEVAAIVQRLLEKSQLINQK